MEPSRPETEDLLLARDRILDLLTDIMPCMIAYWDIELKCRYANRSHEAWFGKTPSELIGHSLTELLGDEGLALDKPFLEGVLRGGTQRFERVIRRPDGKTGCLLVALTPDVVEGEVRGFASHANDITELKETEAALREEVAERQRANRIIRASHAALEEAVRIAQLGSWSWNADDDVTLWSAELYRMMDRDSRLGAPSFADQRDIYTHNSWMRLAEAVKTALSTGRPYRLSLEFRRRDGRLGWLEAMGEPFTDESGRVVGLRGTALDITRHRLAL